MVENIGPCGVGSLSTNRISITLCTARIAPRQQTLRALIEQRGFPHPRKMGAKLFWLVAEVVEWLQGCPRAWGAECELQKE